MSVERFNKQAPCSLSQKALNELHQLLALPIVDKPGLEPNEQAAFGVAAPAPRLLAFALKNAHDRLGDGIHAGHLSQSIKRLSRRHGLPRLPKRASPRDHTLGVTLQRL